MTNNVEKFTINGFYFIRIPKKGIFPFLYLKFLSINDMSAKSIDILADSDREYFIVRLNPVFMKSAQQMQDLFIDFINEYFETHKIKF